MNEILQGVFKIAALFLIWLATLAILGFVAKAQWLIILWGWRLI